jgi:hypothetical protein
MTVVAGADSVTSLPPSPRNHFRLRFYGAVDALRAEVAEGAADAFPFLRGYFAELDATGAEGVRDAAADWEAAARLPIGRLRDVAALDDDALTLLFVAGLVEEDARFGVVFELLHGIPGCRRPTFGLLAAWLGGENGGARVPSSFAVPAAAAAARLPAPSQPSSDSGCSRSTPQRLRSPHPGVASAR